MHVIAITGGIACGKTTVAMEAVNLGATLINADTLSHFLTAPNQPILSEIASLFGDSVLTPEGELNKKVLGDIIFSNDNARKQLNSLLHPLIIQTIQEEISYCKQRGDNFVLLDIPLLFETHMENLPDYIICVTADEETQKQRLMLRDNLTSTQAQERISSQLPLSEKIKKSHLIIDTTLPKEEWEAYLTKNIKQVLKRKENL